jgi:hypothetical protein
MAQVNSAPGQSQVFGNAIVTATSSHVGAGDSLVKSIATVVPYMQSEPGRKQDVAEGKRS